MVINDLYRNANPDVRHVISFDEDVLKTALKRLYDQKFHPMTEIEEGLFEETCKAFHRATDEGFGKRLPDDPDYEFYQAIRQNNEVFSAFKVHRLQNDMAVRLIGEDGLLKSFEQWSNDVQPIADHQVKRWLRTEYDTAVIRAHRAADWRQFEREKDILPNLRWMPTTSLEPYEVHREYWSMRLTLPVDDPFWSTHYPGDHWNCKCYLEATDEPSSRPEHIPHTTEKNAPAAGLDNNPGKDGRLFSDSHPYIKNAYQGAKEAVRRFIDRLHVKVEPKHGADEKYSVRTKEIKKEARAKLQGTALAYPGFSGKITVSRRSIDEWLNQPHRHYAHKNELIFQINDVLKKAKYLGYGKDNSSKPGSKWVHLFETKILGDKSWIIVKEYEDGSKILYSISDSPNILNQLKEK